MKPAVRIGHLATELRSIDNDEFPDDDLNRLRLELAADLDELADEYADRYGKGQDGLDDLADASDDELDAKIEEAFELPDDTDE